MLYLLVDQIASWTDSRGRDRSPYEEFALLDAGARAALEDDGGRFIPWRIGVLTDDWPPSEHSKPVRRDKYSALPTTCYAVGHESAHRYFEELAPFWNEVIRELRLLGTGRMFVRDLFWHPDGRWCDMDHALASEILPGPALQLTRAERNGFSARLAEEELQQLLDVWWPRATGNIAGVVFRTDTSDEVDSELARTGTVSESMLRDITQLYCTTPTFDALGFAVLTEQSLWQQMLNRFGARNWVTGYPVGEW